MDIKTVIKAHGLTQADVASRMGINRITLAQQLSGNPSVAYLRRIADAVGCSVSDFFADERPQPTTPPNNLDGKTIVIDGNKYLLSLLVD